MTVCKRNLAVSTSALVFTLALTACASTSRTPSPTTGPPNVPTIPARVVPTTASAAGRSAQPGCKYATDAEVSAALGRPVKLAAGTDPLCAFVSTDPATQAPFNIQVFRSTRDIDDTRTNLTQSGGASLAALGDDAIWWPTGAALFVHKGGAAVKLQDLSIVTTQADPAKLLPGMTQLADLTLTRL